MSKITAKDGTHIYYKDWGSQHAQPVMFHHGWPLSADSAPLSAKLLKMGTLKVYEKYPHGMCTTHADVINADLHAFFKA